jgi:hypothetical protein
MALKKSVVTNQGFDAIDAYHRVEGVRLISKKNILFQVRSYKNNSGVAAFADTDYDFEYDLTGDNPIKQAYDHLKSLPEFLDAVDC